MVKNGPVILTILDGWGYRAETLGNAIALARKPTYDKLLREYPNTLIHASNHYVGLPDGQMGNSEVGHLNIGAGRIVRMDITRIDEAIASGKFFEDPTLLKAVDVAAQGKALHLIGLVSDGGVHSQQRHLYALLRLAAKHGLQRVFVHAFLDGRDTLPTSGAGYIQELQQKLAEYGFGKLASVSGRYYAMDRDFRWEKEAKAFRAMVTADAPGGKYQDAVARIRESYNNEITDEFVEPFVCIDAQGQPIGPIAEGDAVICFNYRADRVRQITRVLTRNSGLTADGGMSLPKAAELNAEIPLATVPHNLHYVMMTQYDPKFTLPMVIPPESMDNLLANVMAVANLRNLRVAETEKYAHVTYFFNGGREEGFEGETRIMVPSRRDVASYDLAPEMSAYELTDRFVEEIGQGYAFAVINFANPDMVGHTGVIPAVVTAVETADTCLGRVVEAVHAAGGVCLITADHGNAEKMLEDDGVSPHTAHTTNPVPLISTAPGLKVHEGELSDLIPTALARLQLAKPLQMTGSDLADVDQ